jgi:hypothetical protein
LLLHTAATLMMASCLPRMKGTMTCTHRRRSRARQQVCVVRRPCLLFLCAEPMAAAPAVLLGRYQILAQPAGTAANPSCTSLPPPSRSHTPI